MKRVRMKLAILVALVAGCGQAPSPASPEGSVAGTPPLEAIQSPAVSSLEYTWPAKLAAGRYATTLLWDTPFTVRFTVPAGWESRDVEVFTDPVSRVNEIGGPRGRSVMFAMVDNVFADPCDGSLLEPPIDRTVDALADALANLPGVDSTPPAPVTLAGHRGKFVELSVGSGAGCALRDFGMWTTRREWMKPSAHDGGTEFFAERERYRIWVLDVDGVRYLVAALSAADATPADLAELQGVIDSIGFDS
jgi:hypothetical protein